MTGLRSTSRWRTIGTLVVLVPLLVTSGGCVAAGFAAAGPLFTAVQLVADRSIERTLPADLSTALRATADSLTRMGIRVREAERDGEIRVLEGTGTRVTVHAELLPVTPMMTRLSLRVEAGRLTADKRTAEEILNQIASSVSSSNTTASSELSLQLNAQAEMLGTLSAEIVRLRSRLEDDAPAKRASPAPPAPTSSATLPAARGVVEVRTDYAFPRSVPPTDEKASASSMTADRRPVPPAVEGVMSVDPSGGPSVAHPMSPVGVLTPVQPLSGPRNGQ